MLLLMSKILKHLGCFRDTGPCSACGGHWKLQVLLASLPIHLFYRRIQEIKIWDHQIYMLVFFNPNKTKQHSVFSRGQLLLKAKGH